MKTTYGITELRKNFRAILDRVCNGEIITITKRGKPVAKLVPIEKYEALNPVHKSF
jgi:prevent-host-death family protein